MPEFINTPTEIFCGDRYFKEHVMAPGFDYRTHKKEISPYFAKRGFKVSMMYSDYFSRLSGVSSDRYLSMDLYYFYVIPCLNRSDFLEAYSDKNLFSMLFQGVNQPETVVKNRNGIFFDSDEKVVSRDDAIRICLRESASNGCIVKPTVETCNGNGVSLFDGRDERSVAAQFGHFGVNFIVQRKVKQHAEMNRLNPTSLNACRIMTYRGVDGEIKFIRDRSFLRIGRAGAVVDNVSSGGGMCHLHDDGSVSDTIVRYKTMVLGSLKHDHGIEQFIVPNFGRAVDFACALHERLAFFDLIGWDIAIDENGCPLMIEFNARPGVEATQQGAGPMLGNLQDEIMERVLRVRKTRMAFVVNSFRPGFDFRLPVG